jgi:two-component system, response regulator YesN
MFKVMIVDDMEVLRRDVKRLKLWGENSGFIITEEAKDGLDALKKLELNPVDLVITDIRMPNMDGIELLRNISEKKLCPFAVLLSDYTEYNYARQGFMYGAFDYIGKPADEEELAKLLERIRQQLTEKQMEKQKLAELQEIVEEAFFTAADVKQIIEMVCNGETKAAVLTADMVEIVGESYNYDIRKALLVIKSAVNEIINETLKKHQWITTYVDINLLKNIDFADCKDWEEIKAAVVQVEEKLISVVIRFIGCHDSNIVKQACEFVLEHVDGELSVKMLSERLFISKSYLSDIFKQKFGVSLLEYITMVKIECAKMLLREENLKNYEIAYKLGFKDNEYFSKVFKKHTGMSLTEFRQKGF